MPSENEEIAELRKAAQAAVDVDAMTVSEFRDKYDFSSSVSCFSFVASIAREALAHRPPSPPRPRDEAEAGAEKFSVTCPCGMRVRCERCGRRKWYIDLGPVTSCAAPRDEAEEMTLGEWLSNSRAENDSRAKLVAVVRASRDASAILAFDGILAEVRTLRAQADRLQALLAESMTREGAYVKERDAAVRATMRLMDAVTSSASGIEMVDALNQGRAIAESIALAASPATAGEIAKAE